MNNVMEYMGYFAHVEYSAEDECFFGTIAGISDSVSFEGKSALELKQAFQESVDDYLELCKRIGKEPQKAYRGSFNVRIDPELHKKAVITAAINGISLNQLVEKAVEKYVQRVP